MFAKASSSFRTMSILSVPMPCAGDGMEFTARHFTFFRIEVGSDGVYAIGVADHDDLVGELFRFQMQVKATAIGINDKFGRCDHLISGL